MAKKAMTADEKRHITRVVDLGCVVCRNLGYRDSPAEAHHPRALAGGGQRASHMAVLPLCPAHHRNGGHGVAFHAGQETWETKYGTELELLAQVEQLLGLHN